MRKRQNNWLLYPLWHTPYKVKLQQAQTLKNSFLHWNCVEKGSQKVLQMSHPNPNERYKSNIKRTLFREKPLLVSLLVKRTLTYIDQAGRCKILSTRWKTFCRTERQKWFYRAKNLGFSQKQELWQFNRCNLGWKCPI